MGQPLQFTVTPWSNSSSTCACCGRRTNTVWGDVSAQGAALAVYYVQWTAEAPEHDVNIDLVIGAWGEGTAPTDRFLASLLYRPSSEGGSFMVTDGRSRLPTKQDLCSRAMDRAEVIGTPLAHEVFALLDALWLSDPRLAEVKALNDVV
jgi:hypothetical protein